MTGEKENKRNTFEVPEGFEAVRDDDGRATGELKPVAPTTTVNLRGLLETAASLLTRACFEHEMDRITAQLTVEQIRAATEGQNNG